MTSDDHDASRHTAGQDHRASNQPDATSAQHQPSSPSATPSPPTGNGRGQGTQRKQNSLAPLLSLSSGATASRSDNRPPFDELRYDGPFLPQRPAKDAEPEAWESWGREFIDSYNEWQRLLDVAWDGLERALRHAGALDRESYLRVVPPTKGELTCGTGVMFVRRGNGATGFHSWPRYCKRLFCERKESAGRSCRLDWLLRRSEQLADVFGRLPKAWVAVFPTADSEAVIKAAKRSASAAGDKSLRALVHLAGTDLLISNSAIPAGRAGGRWVMEVRGDIVASLFRNAEYHFHLDGRTADGTANPCPWQNLPKVEDDDREVPPADYQLNGPDEVAAFQNEYGRLFNLERGFNPELPTDHSDFRKHCPEMALQLERDALNHVLRIRDARG